MSKLISVRVLDLIKRLYDAFTNDDIITPWDDIEESAPPIHFIYGPPGTGKTTRLCKLLENSYQENPVFKALILVPTNKAGDVIAKKLVSDGANLSLVRIGKATDPEVEALDPDIYQSSLNDAQLDGYNVVISSIHRLPYYQINLEHGAHYHLFSDQVEWDYIIFDESSMLSLPYIVFAVQALMQHNPNAKIIVAGDPKQIPPVVDTSDKDLDSLDIEDENIYKMLGIESFSPEDQELRPIDTIENLTTQYRSIEHIGRLFSKFAYEDLLSHGRNLTTKPRKELPKQFIEEFKKPVTLIDFPIDSENSILMPKKLLYSSYQVYVGILVAELIKHLDSCNIAETKYDNWSGKSI